MELSATGYRLQPFATPFAIPIGWCNRLAQNAGISLKTPFRISRFCVPYRQLSYRENISMTEFDFDTPFSRDGTFAEKHETFRSHNAIPMWVADTDFPAPQCVTDALQERITHGAYGYTDPWPQLMQTTIKWLKDHYDWEVEASWIVWLPGVIPGVNVASAAFTQPDDSIVVQTPNYPPLLHVAGQHGCEPLYVPTHLVEGRWTLDFDALERHFKTPDCTLFILCNPMNPCGTSYTTAELDRITELAYLHGVQICSDEIHCDLILDKGVTHVPMGKLDPTAITLMAASKTFNVAGLRCGFAVIPDVDVRKRFERAKKGWMSTPNLLGLVATAAAFDGGSAWLEAQMDYLRGNLDHIVDFMPRLPGMTLERPDATFLAWMDCSGTGLEHPFRHFLKHGVALSDGADFGAPHFVRLNFGCSRTQLIEALTRMERALGAL